MKDQSKKFNHVIVVTDKKLACALLATGMDTKGFISGVDLKMKYLFPSNNTVRKLIREYYDGELFVPALKFANGYEHLDKWERDTQLQYARELMKKFTIKF